MAIFLLVIIALLMFKLGVLTVIVSILAAAGQIVAFIIGAYVIGCLLNRFAGIKSQKNQRWQP